MTDNIQRGKLSQFKPATKNSNKHTAKGLKALVNSMGDDGYVAPMTAAADGEILDGSARLETAFEKFGDEAIIVKHDGKTPIVMVREDIPDANDPLARRIHYRANMVQWLDFDLDPAIVMADIEAGFNFEAIDITLPDLGLLLRGATSEVLGENDPNEEWRGMPEFEQEDKTAYQSIHVHFKNADEVAEFGKKIGQKLTESTRSIWYSERERMDYGTDRYRELS